MEEGDGVGEVGRWKEWNGLMEREKGKELVRSGWPGGWYIEANDGKGR
jgi:hypothetical protein